MWKDLVNCLLVILLLLQIRGGECLRLLRLSVPPYKMRGESAFLECDYDLEGNTLYAVKWYKDNEEFYRYVPRASPPQHSYNLEGVRVIMEQSNAKQVVLRTVNLKSIGDYRCEVSAEKPRFVSDSKEARMEVIYFPTQSPIIVGADERLYSIGEELKLNCSSAKAHPSLDLDWYINDVKVPEIGGSLERHKPT
ncbi:beat protein, partial [Nesidiocoris tenuis]